MDEEKVESSLYRQAANINRILHTYDANVISIDRQKLDLLMDRS